MPKLYEYFGLIVMFYANEHEPIHVHGKTEMTDKIINIISANLVGDYRIRLRFDDGTEQTVDFRPFLTASLHPDIRRWLDPARFSDFHIEYGELVWGDYDLCFPVIDLHRNDLEHRYPMETAA